MWSAKTTSSGLELGFLRDLGALDFAGGTVVHMASGFSALTACVLCGPRRNVDLRSPPDGHNVPMFVLGTVILWFVGCHHAVAALRSSHPVSHLCETLDVHRIGWFGFNGGSALAANDIAVQAMYNAHISAATAFSTWMVIDAVTKRAVTLVSLSPTSLPLRLLHWPTLCRYAA